jgi:LL-diaminopimelate aminotransferase
MELMEKSGMIVTPGAAFGSLGEGYVRMALVLPPDQMKAAAEAVQRSGIIQNN